MTKTQKTNYRKFTSLLVLLVCLTAAASLAKAQTTTFTYQGRLTDNSMPPTEKYDFQFRLYNPLNAPFAPIVVEDVQVTNGVFTAEIPVPAGTFSTSPLSPRSLEIGVRPFNSTGAFTILSLRQAITNAPYADVAVNAGNAGLLNNIPASGFVLNNSTVTPQSNASFNISGNGTLGGTIRANNGTIDNNLTVDNALTTGTLNTFDASVSNNLNVQGNVTAQGTFTGSGSGLTSLNATNVSSGTLAVGRGGTGLTSAGGAGSFLRSNGTSWTSSAIQAVDIPNLDASKITTGTIDARLSSNIPRLNIANNFNGTQSAGIFDAATQFNLGGNRILFSPNSTSIVAGIGAGGTAIASASNSFFGASAGAVNTSGAANSFFGRDAGSANITGSNNTFVGAGAGEGNTSGSSNSFFGINSGFQHSTGGGNTFIGTAAGATTTTGDHNTLLGRSAALGANNLTYATAIGAGAVAANSNTVRLGRPNGADTVTIPGNLELENLNSGGGSNGACFIYGENFVFARIAACGSSLRYKTNVADFTTGLELVRRLRPVTFTWKSNNMSDLGFVAEEVAAAEPLMATYNKAGEVEGVKYDRISAALVNAVNEQQIEIETQKTIVEKQNARIEAQQEIIERQQKQLDALFKLVCAGRTSAGEVCRPEEK